MDTIVAECSNFFFFWEGGVRGRGAVSQDSSDYL